MQDQPCPPPVALPLPDPPLGPLAWICFLLALYLLAISALDVVCIYDVRIGNLAMLTRLGLALPAAAADRADLSIAVLTMAGASLGACLLSFLGLFQYAVLTTGFNPRFVGSYLVGPIAVIFLGFGAFILARAGLFVFGNVDNVSQITPNNELSFLGLGILVGFSWNRVLAKFAEIGTQVFSSSGRGIPIALEPRRPRALPSDPAQSPDGALL